MTRLLRLVGIIAASALVITGAITGAAAITVGLVTHTASGRALPLPALTSSALGGSTVYADDGTTVLGVLQASQDRKPIPLAKVSKVLITAVLDTEDHNFYIHGGFDIPSLVRALAADTSSNGVVQGGSTIAQQLVKQTYLTPQKTLSRKIKEAILADRLEQEYTKDEILQAYLNTVYFGSSAYGVEAASNVYFNEHAAQLTLPQAALLAGLIQNPSGYDPIIHPAEARSRRSEVLSRMEHYHDITTAQETAANETPLPTSSFLAPPPSTDTISNYYVNEVKNELLGPNSPLGDNYDERWQALFEGGLKIYTNLDPTMQAEAEQTVAADTPPNSQGFEEALVSIDPATGKVRALVGGNGTGESQFDIITQGTRQPGSGFKLFTLLAALTQGYSVYDTVLGHSPCAIAFPGDDDYVKTPAVNDSQAGVISLVSATADSVNCAYLRLAHEVGLQNVADMAESMGVGSASGDSLPVVPAMVLGADVVHPIEMAAAYATVADGGIYHAPSFIDHIIDRSGSVIYTGENPGQQVFSAQVAEEATVALQAVVQYGTATEAALYNRPVAGKTGTTTHSVDAWFNGFTPQMETTIWMGSLQGEVPMYGVIGVGEVYGGTVPARTWHDYMSQVLNGLPVVPFTPPNPRQLPPTKYITSPGLVRDDVLDHNEGYVPPPPGRVGPANDDTDLDDDTDADDGRHRPAPQEETLTRADLEGLMAVQDLDTAIDQHRHRRANLPERVAVADIDAEASSLRRQVGEATPARDRVAAEQGALEAELAATEDRAASVSRRLYGGEVSVSRELQAMAADVDSLKARASALEDQILELLETREPLDARLAELTSSAAGLAERRQTAVDALAAAEAVVDDELSALEGERSARAAALPDSLMATYDRLRVRLAGLGAARLVGNHCDGCHLTLPATELDRFRHLPLDEVVTCDQCGRILVRT